MKELDSLLHFFWIAPGSIICHPFSFNLHLMSLTVIHYFFRSLLFQYTFDLFPIQIEWLNHLSELFTLELLLKHLIVLLHSVYQMLPSVISRQIYLFSRRIEFAKISLVIPIIIIIYLTKWIIHSQGLLRIIFWKVIKW